MAINKRANNYNKNNSNLLPLAPKPQPVVTFSKSAFFNSTSANFSAALNIINSHSTVTASATAASAAYKRCKVVDMPVVAQPKLQPLKRKLNNENGHDPSPSNSKKRSAFPPPPPPLLPVYKSTTTTTTTSANSSRLASASGMMPTLKLPKLEPCLPPPKLPKMSHVVAVNCDTATKTTTTTQMPKLKPQQNIINNFGQVPPPPQLESFGLERLKSKSKTNNVQSWVSCFNLQ